MKRIILSMLFSFLGFGVHAQIATPSLDPSISHFLPSTAAFRFTGIIGAEMVAGEIEKDVSGDQEESEGDSTSAILAFRIGKLGIEGLYQRYEMESDGVDEQGIFEKKSITSFTQAHLNYLFGDSLGIGVGQYTRLSETKFEGTGISMKKESKIRGVILGATYRLGEVLFIAAGAQNVVSTGHSELTYPAQSAEEFDADLKELTWMDTIAGIGLVLGDPGGFQFKVEGSIISSPEKTEEASGEEIGNGKQQYTISDAGIEFKFGDLFISYGLSTTVKEKFENNDTTIGSENESVTEVNSIVIGLAQQEGMALKLRVENEMEIEKKPEGDVETSGTSYGLGISYTFIPSATQ